MKATYCKECGEQIPPNMEICPNCGYPKKTKSKWNVVAFSIGIVSILCVVAISFCILGNKAESNKVCKLQYTSRQCNAAICNKAEKVKVDPSLVRIGGMGYSVFEEENGREVTGGISLMYDVDSTRTYQGSMRYYPNKNKTDFENQFDIPVIGEVADDGGLIFKGSLDNVAYTLHILNTHGTLNDDTYLNSYEAVFTRGNKSRKIFIGFEHYGEEGD